MNLFKKYMMLIFLLAILLSAETITLQEGVNGYSGCTDTYIESENQYGYNGTGTNHGNEGQLAAGYLRYLDY